jgi:hypothetical protein
MTRGYSGAQIRLVATATERWRNRQNAETYDAMKGTLRATCVGGLGVRNARFGEPKVALSPSSLRLEVGEQVDESAHWVAGGAFAQVRLVLV